MKHGGILKSSPQLLKTKSPPRAFSETLIIPPGAISPGAAAWKCRRQHRRFGSYKLWAARPEMHASCCSREGKEAAATSPANGKRRGRRGIDGKSRWWKQTLEPRDVETRWKDSQRGNVQRRKSTDAHDATNVPFCIYFQKSNLDIG